MPTYGLVVPGSSSSSSRHRAPLLAEQMRRCTRGPRRSRRSPCPTGRGRRGASAGRSRRGPGPRCSATAARTSARSASSSGTTRAPGSAAAGSSGRQANSPTRTVMRPRAALEGDVLDGEPGHPAVQEPRHRDQQTGRPGVAVQAEAGDHVGAGLLSVVPQHLRVVPGEERVEGGAAGRELVRRRPSRRPTGSVRRRPEFRRRAARGRPRSAGCTRPTRRDVVVPGSRVGRVMQGPPNRDRLQVSLTLPEEIDV